MTKTQSIALAFAFLASFLVHPQVVSWNDAARMATVQSLVEKQTFVIDDSAFVDTGDKVFINGHFYLDKPVFPSLMGAVVYYPLYQMGLKLDYGWNLAYFLITVFTIKLFWLLSLIAFFKSLQFTKLGETPKLWLTAALAFASLHLTWSSTFSNHSLAASALMIAFYFLLKARHAPSNWAVSLSGLFAAVAAVSDVPMAAFYVALGGCLLLDAKLRSRIVFYLLPLGVTLLPWLWINYSISGSVVPFQLVKSYFDYPGSPFANAAGLSGVQINGPMFSIRYGALALFGPKGFVLYNPLLLIAIPWAVVEIVRKRAFRIEAIAILAASIVVVGYYFLFTKNYGGHCYSIRWFVPLLPLLYFFLHPLFDDPSHAGRRLFFALLIVSAFFAWIGLVNPWSNGNVSSIPLWANLKLLLFYLIFRRAPGA